MIPIAWDGSFSHRAGRGIRVGVDDTVECAALVAVGARAKLRCACQSEGPVDRGGSRAVVAARRRGSTRLRGTGRAPCGLAVRHSGRESHDSRHRVAARRRPGRAPTFVGLAWGPVGQVGRASPESRGRRSPPPRSSNATGPRHAVGRRHRDLSKRPIPLGPCGLLILCEIDSRDRPTVLPAPTRRRRSEPQRIGPMWRLPPPRTGDRHSLDRGGHNR